VNLESTIEENLEKDVGVIAAEDLIVAKHCIHVHMHTPRQTEY